MEGIAVDSAPENQTTPPATGASAGCATSVAHA
jgi:hypothetical protein